MKFNVYIHPNPLMPMANVEALKIPINYGDTVSTVLNKLGITFGNTMVYVNGVHCEDYTRGLAPHDMLNICATVHGGGGGSNPIATIASIALLAAAPGVGAFATTALGGAAAGAVAKGLFVIGGQYLINNFLAPSTPAANGGQVNPTSPTYDLTGGRNSIRVDQPIPIIIGTHKFVPDLQAQPYNVYQDNDQYLYAAFNLGYSTDVNVSGLKIGNDVFANYSDLTYELSTGSTGELTLFPQNVDTVSGGTLVDKADSIVKTSSTDAVALQVDIVVTAFVVNDRGNMDKYPAYFDLEYRQVGAGTWLPFTGTARIEVIGDSPTRLRKSYYLQVPTEAQYEVRVTRQTPDFTNSPEYKITCSIEWAALKTHQKDTSTYDNQKRMALKVRASNQIQGSLDTVSCIIDAQTLAWNGSSWALSSTSNPAWWFLNIARGRYNGTSGLLEYGGGLADSQIDIDGLKTWGAWCTAEGLTVNYVLDSSMTVEDCLNLIARCGRASISYHSGKLGVVYDEEDRAVTYMFGPGNIIQDSFQVTYESESLIDQVIVEFVNAAEDYKLDQVKVNVPGVVSPVNPIKLKIEGVTSETQAAAEANLIAAEQFYRRKRVTFETDIEGLLVKKGDVVALSHDLTSWGQGGRLDNAGAQSTTALTLDRAVSFDDGAGATYYISVRHPDGTIDTVTVQYSASPTASITLLSSLSQDPSAYANNDPEDAIYTFDPQATPGQKLKIVSITPQQPDVTRVKLTCIEESAAYYATRNGAWTHVTYPTNLARTATISNVELQEEVIDTNGRIKCVLTWDATGDCIGANIRLQHRKDSSTDAQLVNVGIIYASRYEFYVDAPEDLTVELLPIPENKANATAQTISASFVIQGIYSPNQVLPKVPNVTGLKLIGGVTATEFTGNGPEFLWNKVTAQQDANFLDRGRQTGLDEELSDSNLIKDYMVRVYTTGDVLLRTDYVSTERYTYDIEKNREDTGNSPNRSFKVKVWVRGKQNQLSERAASITVNNPAPAALTILSTDSSSNTAFIDVNTSTDADLRGYGVWMDTSSPLTPVGTDPSDVGSNMVYKGVQDSIAITNLVAGTTYYFKVAAYDAFGLDSLNYTTEFSVTPSNIELVDGSVTTAKLADLAVTLAKVGSNAIDSTKITSGAVTTPKIAANAVTATEIAASAVSTDKLAANAVTAGKIAALTITASEIASNAITAAKINASAVTADKINAGAVTTAKLDANAVTAAKIAANTITASEIASGTITATQIASNTITATQIAADAITTSELAANSITAAKGQISNLTVSTVKIQDQAVSIPVSAYTSTESSYTTGSDTTAQSASITSTGAPISIIFSVSNYGDSSGTGYTVKIKRDTTTIYTSPLITTTSNEYTQFSANISETPGSGTYTYYLTMAPTGGTQRMSRRSLLLLETKK